MDIETIKRLCPEFKYGKKGFDYDAGEFIRALSLLAEAREALESKKAIVDAAIEWQSYWSENIGDRHGIDMRQGYLYDRVRYYRKRTQPPKEGG
ncbi:MAG: hypothetical protein ABFD50_08260 [Smithella sp.]